MREVECPVCGKVFIIAPKNIFKVMIEGKVKHLCGWNCLRKIERESGGLRKSLRRDNMRYVIVGGACFIIGALVGVFTLALVSINKNTEIVEPKEDKCNG